MNRKDGWVCANCRDDGGPVVVGRLVAGALAPRAGERVVHHEHRHVAAHAVALVGDPPERLDHRRPQRGGEGVELDDVGPRREVGVAAVGQHTPGDVDERSGVGGEVLRRALHEALRVRRRPWVVRCHVVRDEVEDQTESPPGEGGPGGGETRTAAEGAVDLVVPDAVRRPDHVVGAVVGKCGAEAVDQTGVGQRHGDAGRAPLPDPHQPDRVEPGVGDGIPLLVGHAREVHSPAGLDTELVQPRPGVDLVHERMSRRSPTRRLHGAHRRCRAAPAPPVLPHQSVRCVNASTAASIVRKRRSASAAPCRAQRARCRRHGPALRQPVPSARRAPSPRARGPR